MAETGIEPREIIELVESYVRRALSDAERYENSAPLDEAGVYDLHQLAREIYARGVNDGRQQESLRNYGAQQRERDRVAATANTSTPTEG